MPKIALDVSPLSSGDSVRGVGYFAKNIIEPVQKLIKTDPAYKNWQVDLVTKATSGYDLYHYPFFHPFRLTLPTHHKPFIVSIYDLMPRQFKEHFPVGFKGEIKWLIQKYRARKAKYIITSSHYSKYIISDLLNYKKDRIYVTWGASNSSFKVIKNKNKLKKIKTKYNLPSKFILYVGDINWNKNIPNLVRACQKLNYPLVIVGKSATQKNVPQHPWTKDLLWLQKQKYKKLQLLGFVPDSDLPSIYNLATLYCQPSYAEGFGLPVLEAMVSGCPVVYSNQTSLPEIADYNGIFFNPYKKNELSQALKKLYTNPKLQQKYKKMGLKHAQTFNWQLTAKQTLEIYRLALIDAKT